MTVDERSRPIRKLFDAITDAAARATNEMLDRAEQATEAVEDGEARGHDMEYVNGVADAYEDAATILLDELSKAEDQFTPDPEASS